MTSEDDTVIIESRKGPKERPTAPLAILACAEADRRRFRQQTTAIAGSSRSAYNSRFFDVSHANQPITVAGPILGAPQAVLVLEKLIALGSRVVVVFGWCGSLQSDLKIGDWLLPTSAHSEEGTSKHYPLTSPQYLPDPSLSGRLQDYCESHGFKVQSGPVWSTDAPLRETVAKVRAYGNEGILGVEMEMSALFHVAAYRKIRLAGLLVVSDELSTLKWKPGLTSTRFKRSCSQATEALLDFCANLPPHFFE
jgi:uridine phosphorylase